MKQQIFTIKELLKVGSNYICLGVIGLDSVLNNDGKYYPQMFLKECKYIEKAKKVIRHINYDLRDFSYYGGSGEA